MREKRVTLHLLMAQAEEDERRHGLTKNLNAKRKTS
jgi:hypothetical protein